MKARFLEEAEVRTRILHIWASNPMGGFFGKSRKVVKFYKGYCLKRAKAQREIEDHLRVQLAEAMEALQVDLGNGDLQERLSDLRERLSEVEKTISKGSR